MLLPSSLTDAIKRHPFIFVTGTDTNVGKTFVSSFLCHIGSYAYWKPIQTGTQKDSSFVASKTSAFIFDEAYHFKAPVSPHLSASLENKRVDLEHITLPRSQRLIVEGAGGVFTPINETCFMVDLIARMNIPVIVVARSTLGTINHTCLTLKILNDYAINVLGVIMNGPINRENVDSVEHFGKKRVLFSLPLINKARSKWSWQEFL